MWCEVMETRFKHLLIKVVTYYQKLFDHHYPRDYRRHSQQKLQRHRKHLRGRGATHKTLLIGKNTTETWITIFKLNAKQWWQGPRAEPQESQRASSRWYFVVMSCVWPQYWLVMSWVWPQYWLVMSCVWPQYWLQMRDRGLLSYLNPFLELGILAASFRQVTAWTCRFPDTCRLKPENRHKFC